MGPSGSGKTTLLSLVGGLDRPTTGQVLVADQDVGRLESRGLAILRRRIVGYVFQDLNLLAGLTADENVSLPLELNGRRLSRANRRLGFSTGTSFRYVVRLPRPVTDADLATAGGIAARYPGRDRARPRPRPPHAPRRPTRSSSPLGRPSVRERRSAPR